LYSQIIVREDEPSSIIALTLSSPQYVEKLKGIFSSEMDPSQAHNHSNRHHHHHTSGTATPSDETVSVSPMDGHAHLHHHHHQQGASSSSYPGGSNASSTTEGIYDDIHVSEESLLSEPGTHMKFRKYRTEGQASF